MAWISFFSLAFDPKQLSISSFTSLRYLGWLDLGSRLAFFLDECGFQCKTSTIPNIVQDNEWECKAL
jgi:hypothetical protein